MNMAPGRKAVKTVRQEGEERLMNHHDKSWCWLNNESIMHTMMTRDSQVKPAPQFIVVLRGGSVEPAPQFIVVFEGTFRPSIEPL